VKLQPNTTIHLCCSQAIDTFLPLANLIIRCLRKPC
jgi:hypothetical protein